MCCADGQLTTSGPWAAGAPKEGFFAERVEQDPDIILKERQAALL